MYHVWVGVLTGIAFFILAGLARKLVVQVGSANQSAQKAPIVSKPTSRLQETLTRAYRNRFSLLLDALFFAIVVSSSYLVMQRAWFDANDGMHLQHSIYRLFRQAVVPYMSGVAIGAVLSIVVAGLLRRNDGEKGIALLTMLGVTLGVVALASSDPDFAFLRNIKSGSVAGAFSFELQPQDGSVSIAKSIPNVNLSSVGRSTPLLPASYALHVLGEMSAAIDRDLAFMKDSELTGGLNEAALTVERNFLRLVIEPTAKWLFDVAISTDRYDPYNFIDYADRDFMIGLSDLIKAQNQSDRLVALNKFWNGLTRTWNAMCEALPMKEKCSIDSERFEPHRSYFEKAINDGGRVFSSEHPYGHLVLALFNFLNRETESSIKDIHDWVYAKTNEPQGNFQLLGLFRARIILSDMIYVSASREVYLALEPHLNLATVHLGYRIINESRWSAIMKDAGLWRELPRRHWDASCHGLVKTEPQREFLYNFIQQVSNFVEAAAREYDLIKSSDLNKVGGPLAGLRQYSKLLASFRLECADADRFVRNSGGSRPSNDLLVLQEQVWMNVAEAWLRLAGDSNFGLANRQTFACQAMSAVTKLSINRREKSLKEMGSLLDLAQHRSFGEIQAASQQLNRDHAKVQLMERVKRSYKALADKADGEGDDPDLKC